MPKCKYCGQGFATESWTLAHERTCKLNERYQEDKRRSDREIKDILNRYGLLYGKVMK